MNHPALKRFGLRLALLILASYGTLYFAYKWNPGDVDFRSIYSEMDQRPLDLGVTDIAHVLRQASPIITYLLYKSGIYYSTAGALWNVGVDPHIFFAALLTDFIGLALAAALAGSIVEHEGGDGLAALMAGGLCLLSFHAQNFVLTGSIEGMTWAFVALIYLLVQLGHRWLIALVLFLSIFQRELIVVAFSAMSVFALMMKKDNAKTWRFVLITSLACFAVYVIIRKLLSPVDSSGQLSLGHLIASAGAIRFGSTLLMQGLVSQNVAIICLFVGAALWLEGGRPVEMTPILMATFATLVVIALLEGELAGDVGNVSGILTPLFASAAAIGMGRLGRIRSRA
jgi:hypothetical protein